jgi:CRP-like cAMP-binding protein
MGLLARKHSYDKLAEIPFFEGWTDEELAHVDKAADYVAYKPGEALIKQGTTGYEFIVILEGNVDVTVDGEAVASLSAGDHVGEMALLSHEKRNATVVATDDVRALLVGSREFRALVDLAPSLDKKLVASLTQRQRS